MRKISKILAFFCLTTMLLVLFGCTNILATPGGAENPLNILGEDYEIICRSPLIGSGVPSNITFSSEYQGKDKQGYLKLPANTEVNGQTVAIGHFDGFAPDHFTRYDYLVLNVYLGNIKLADTDIDGDYANANIKVYSENDKVIDLEKYLNLNESKTVSYIVPTHVIGNDVYAIDIIFGGKGYATVKSMYLISDTDPQINPENNGLYLNIGGFSNLLAKASKMRIKAVAIDTEKGAEDGQFPQTAIDEFDVVYNEAQSVYYSYGTTVYTSKTKLNNAQYACDVAANKLYQAYLKFKAAKVIVGPPPVPAFVPADAIILYSSKAGKTSEHSDWYVWANTAIQAGTYWSATGPLFMVTFNDVGKLNWYGGALAYSKKIPKNAHVYISVYTKIDGLNIQPIWSTGEGTKFPIKNTSGEYQWVTLDFKVTEELTLTQLAIVDEKRNLEGEKIYIDACYAYIPQSEVDALIKEARTKLNNGDIDKNELEAAITNLEIASGQKEISAAMDAIYEIIE